MERLPKVPTRLVGPDDVCLAYRLFLGREPESDALIRLHLGSSLAAFWPAFPRSDEFSENVLKPALAGRENLAHRSPPSYRLVIWAKETFCFDVSSIATTGQLLAGALRSAAPTLSDTWPAQMWLYLALCLERDASISTSPVDDFLTDVLKSGRDAEAAQLAYQALLRLETIRPPTGSDLSDPRVRSSIDALLQHDRRLIEDSGLWNLPFYLRQQPALIPGSDPLGDFIIRGAHHGHDPHPLFSTSHYQVVRMDAGDPVPNPLVHYLRHGHRADLAPNALFSPDWYRRVHLGGADDVEPLGHYATKGVEGGLRPHPLFDQHYYESLYPDVAGANMHPYEHFIRHGQREGRRAFDTKRAGETLKIAVFANIGSDSFWPALLTRLDVIPVSFDLIVTIPLGAGALHKQIMIDAPSARIIKALTNQYALPQRASASQKTTDKHYDLICRIDINEDSPNPVALRHVLLESVIRSSDYLRRLFAQFETYPNLSIVGARSCYLDGPAEGLADRDRLTAFLRAAYGSEAELPSTWGFFAGSAFWMRPEHFSSLIEAMSRDIAGDFREVDDPVTFQAELFGAAAALQKQQIGLIDAYVSPPEGSDVSASPKRLGKKQYLAHLEKAEQYLTPTLPELRKLEKRRWSRPVEAQPGINFVGPVEAVNGLGVSARGYVHALTEAEIPVKVVKWRVGFERVNQQRFASTKVEAQPLNIVHLNLDLLSGPGILNAPPLQDLLGPNRFNIAIVYWELMALRPEWMAVINVFDEIWVPSQFMASAIGAISSRPVRVLRPSLPKNQVSPDAGAACEIAPGRFLFAYSADSGSVMKRKNPQLLWRIYAETFTPADGAALAIKLHYPDPGNRLIEELKALSQARPDIIYISESLSETQLAAFFERIDCYVSPHRSEGLGLTILEAMQAGKPVIATAYGGAADFVNHQTAFVIDHRLTEVGENAAPYPANYVWADPEPASLRLRLKEALQRPDLAAEKARKAEEVCESLFGLAATSAALEKEVRRIWASGG